MPTYKVGGPEEMFAKISQTPSTSNGMGIRNRFYVGGGGYNKDNDWYIYRGVTPLTISGTVYDSTGAAVVGANVLLFRNSDNKMIAATVSDGSGHYSFDRDPTDPYTYYVAAYTTVSGTQIHGTSDHALSPV